MLDQVFFTATLAINEMSVFDRRDILKAHSSCLLYMMRSVQFSSVQLSVLDLNINDNQYSGTLFLQNELSFRVCVTS